MTAVEWLEERLDIDLVDNGWYFEKAKEIEKQQIMKAVYESMGTNIDPNMGRAELYYNETYKNTKE
jgi:hypothetical protein